MSGPAGEVFSASKLVGWRIVVSILRQLKKEAFDKTSEYSERQFTCLSNKTKQLLRCSSDRTEINFLMNNSKSKI